MDTKLYCEDDPKTTHQFYECMRQPFSLKGALMPDAHLGYTMPIGGVILTEDVIVPEWVGYDIGCGVLTAQVHESEMSLRDIQKAVRDAVPMGRNKHNQAPNLDVSELSAQGMLAARKRDAVCQMGTLGGGNHFIELGEDSVGDTWITIHSGSRGVGHEIGGYYMKESDGRGFKKGTAEYEQYLNDMNWCINYALDNRLRMLNLVCGAIDTKFRIGSVVNQNHNHAVVTPEGILHRKGATDASMDMPGVIPGNMKDGVYIVKGLGNPDSLDSCSHGAGRLFSRRQAKKVLSLKDFSNDMKGILAGVRKENLDECPRAYKDFDEVMKKQDSLCEIVNHIKPVVNWKG